MWDRKEDRGRFFPVVPSDRIQNNRNKSSTQEIPLKPYKKHKFFYTRVFKYWNELPTQVVLSPSTGFKILSSRKVSEYTDTTLSREVDQMISRGPFPHMFRAYDANFTNFLKSEGSSRKTIRFLTLIFKAFLKTDSTR